VGQLRDDLRGHGLTGQHDPLGRCGLNSLGGNGVGAAGAAASEPRGEP
jgi:hypothetical protein